MPVTKGGLMRKRILISALSLFVFISAFIMLYHKFDSKADALEPRTIDKVITDNIDITELKNHLKEHQVDHVLFIQDGSQDAQYVYESILTPLANEQEEQALPKILVVEIPKESQISVTRLENMLGIKRYPAFVYVRPNKGSYKIVSTIEYDAKKPFTADELKTWFFENNLWSGPYGVRD